MYKIDLSNEKKNFVLPAIFFGVGLILLICYLFVFIRSNNKSKRMDSLVEAYKINERVSNNKGTTMYSYSFDYIVDGKKYTCDNNIKSSEKVTDEHIIIEYNSKNPIDCMSPFEKSTIAFLALIDISIGGVFMVVSGLIMILMLIKIYKKKSLTKNGILIKNVPYEMVPTNITYNGVKLFKIEANINLPNGEMKKVCSSPRYDKKQIDEDGHADVLIDPKNYNNYFIDFNIEEI